MHRAEAEAWVLLGQTGSSGGPSLLAKGYPGVKRTGSRRVTQEGRTGLVQKETSNILEHAVTSAWH
jgi:hypothetical protein